MKSSPCNASAVSGKTAHSHESNNAGGTLPFGTGPGAGIHEQPIGLQVFRLEGDGVD